MKPLRCNGTIYVPLAERKPGERFTRSCPNTGTPAQMFAIPEDPDSGPSPHCETCARRIYNDTVAGAPIPYHAIPKFEGWFERVEDDDCCPNPADEDLMTWAQENGAGCADFVEAVASAAIDAGVPLDVTTVPYGNTWASWYSAPDFEAIEPAYVLEVAQKWWDEGRLEWAADVSPINGSVYLTLRNDDNKEG